MAVELDFLKLVVNEIVHKKLGYHPRGHDEGGVYRENHIQLT